MIKKSKGFTLIELIMVIVLLGSLAGILSGVLGQFARIFSDTETRSELTMKARLAMERMSREIRRNVPFGIYEISSDNIEFVTASTGGRYIEQGYPHVNNATCPVIQRFKAGVSRSALCLIHSNDASSPPFTVNDNLIIGNNSVANLRALNTVVTLTSVPNQATCTAQTPPNSCPPIWPVVGFSAKTFPNESTGKHYLIADTTHEIDLVGTTLYWRTADNVDTGLFNGAAGDASTILGTGDNILAENVSSLVFSQNLSKGVMSIKMTLTQNGNSVDLYEEINIRNVP